MCLLRSDDRGRHYVTTSTAITHLKAPLWWASWPGRDGPSFRLRHYVAWPGSAGPVISLMRPGFSGPGRARPDFRHDRVYWQIRKSQ